MGCANCASERRLRLEWQQTASYRSRLLEDRGHQLAQLRGQLAAAHDRDVFVTSKLKILQAGLDDIQSQLAATSATLATGEEPDGGKDDA